MDQVQGTDDTPVHSSVSPKADAPTVTPVHRYGQGGRHDRMMLDKNPQTL